MDPLTEIVLWLREQGHHEYSLRVARAWGKIASFNARIAILETDRNQALERVAYEAEQVLEDATSAEYALNPSQYLVSAGVLADLRVASDALSELEEGATNER